MQYLLILLFLIGFSSCAKIKYMDEALCLQAYSNETDARDAMIAHRQQIVKALVERVAAGDRLEDLRTKADLLSRLEGPVLVEPEGSGVERWLYRDPVKYFDTPKVYFFVDPQGQVLRWTQVGIAMNPSGKNDGVSEN